MYRKSLLALVVLAALPVTAATDRTLYVTTLDDEDGENASACSLREALKAATDNRAYGGCIAGQLDLTDQIKLKAGIYNLKKPLIIGSDMTITGGDAANFEKEDPYIKDGTQYPARGRLETTIQPAEGLAFTLFDSTSSRSTFSLNKVILKNGKSNRGGAIRAGGTVNLSRVRISNSVANDVGGAIYLEGSSANLTAADSLFDHNNASRGAVIGMSCLDNLDWTQHSVTLERTSIYDNGFGSAKSIIDYCGTVTSTVTSSTIAENKIAKSGTNNTDNAIIKYNYSEAYKLHTDSSLALTSNTIVKNDGSTTLLYDNVGTLNITNNILAFNTGGKSCSYALGTAEADKLEKNKSNISAAYNALTKPGTAAEGECVLPSYLYKEDKSTAAIVSLIPTSFTQVLAPLYLNGKDLESAEGLFPAYIPKNSSSSETLINKGDISCSATDQRGLTRNISTSGSSTSTSSNMCDIGSIEVSKLTAADLSGATNISLVTLGDQYQVDIDYYENIYKDKSLDTKLVNRYKLLVDNAKKTLAAFEKNRAYRQVYASVLNTSTEQEIVNVVKDGQGDAVTSELQKFGNDFNKNYIVIPAVVGRGTEQFIQSKDDKDISVKADDSNLVCSWDKDLKQILIRRTDNTDTLAATTPAGEYEYCKYTIISTSQKNPKVESTGYVQARIVNIAPVAKADKFTVVYGSVKPLALNILANDNDDGDGGPDVADYPKGYPVFYQDPGNGRYANIKLVTKPALGTLQFEYEQPCPDNSKTRPEETCYGGKITYTPKNTFSTFNDSFKYKVLDQDKAESNEAIVTLTNTATTNDDTRGGSSGGGGSVGLFSLLGLAGLALMRRKMR